MEINYNIEPILLVDQLSDTEMYFGTSINGEDIASFIWRIKRIIKVGNVWTIGFPNGDQSFSYAWNDRFLFSYK